MQPKEFFPQFEQSNFSLLISLEPGTSLSANDAIIKQIEDILKSEQRINYFFASVGRSTEDQLSYYLEDSQTEHLAEIKVAIHPQYSTAEVINSLRTKIAKLPIDFVFKRGDNELLSFLDLGESGLKLRIYGSEYESIEKIAEEVYSHLQAHELFYDISASHKNKAPFIHMKVNREALALYRVDVSTIARALKTYIAGDKISDFYIFSDKIDISLKSESDVDLNELLQMQIISDGNLYPLRTFVQAEERYMPLEIEHINQYQVLSFSLLADGSFQEALLQLQLLIDDIGQQDGVFLKIEGINQQIDESLHSLILALIFAILLVYMILASQFESFLLPLIIMFTVPMGLIGVAGALLISGTSINAMSTLGMIILAGIIVNDAILLVDRINKLHQNGLDLDTAIMDAAQTRFRPILMTTLTTVFGLLPLALAIGSGAELQSAIAISVIGGILSATFLTMIFIPLIYSVLVKDKKQMRKL
jgi:HAE1 family hydrophobic/amphiphilic exporter-1